MTNTVQKEIQMTNGVSENKGKKIRTVNLQIQNMANGRFTTWQLKREMELPIILAQGKRISYKLRQGEYRQKKSETVNIAFTKK